MTAIERTVYPRFAKSRQISNKQLHNFYSPSAQELDTATQHTNDGFGRLRFLVMLKSFQRLGYFPALEDVPVSIVRHIANCIGLVEYDTATYASDRSIQRYKQFIRNILGVKTYDEAAKDIILHVGYKACLTINDPADIINIMIEELIAKYYELPSFEVIDKVARLCRAKVNAELFKQIAQMLPDDLKKTYSTMINSVDGNSKTAFNDIKKLPKKATITNVHDFIAHHNWLAEFGNMRSYLEIIAKPKIKSFANWAKTLDARDMRDLKVNKRDALLTCLLYEAQTKAKDSLAQMLCKTANSLHKKAKRHLESLKINKLKKAGKVAQTLTDILSLLNQKTNKHKRTLENVLSTVKDHGGPKELQLLCDEIIAYASQDYTYLIQRFVSVKIRSAFLQALKTLKFTSSTQDKKLMLAIKLLLKHQHAPKDKLIETAIDLSFLSRQWQKLVIVKKKETKKFLNKAQFETSVFLAVAEQLRSGDLAVASADKYEDYKINLLPWQDCEDQVPQYCQDLNLATNGKALVKQLKEDLSLAATTLDERYPHMKDFIIDKDGRPKLKKKPTKGPKMNWLQKEIIRRMPERNILDLLCSTHHYAEWAIYFGPLSGNEPKMKNAIEKYILTTFAYGSGMGPVQGAKHFKGCDVSAHILSWINKRHVTIKAIDQAITSLINISNRFQLVNYWGDGKSCAADGTLCSIYEDNLMAAFHVRYGAKGGIAYYHIANNYIAIFSTFIPCGVWEVVAILDAILNNKSDIKPDTVNADTQGQSLVAFAMAYLLGIKLMPRIRNWKDFDMYRPHPNAKYKNVDALFSAKSIKWQLIEELWNDMMQVVLSIKAGKISSSHLLQRLTNYAKKNKLLQAFQELGKVVRTMFLIEYVSSIEVREEITANTNKVESYNNFSAWIRFNYENYIIASNDPDEQEKAVKYNCLIANAIILQNIVDISNIIIGMMRDGICITEEDIKHLSPYITAHIKRFGDYIINILSRFIPREQKLELECVAS